jgi:uncharacterized membrane protein
MIPLACALAGPVLAELTAVIESQVDLPAGWTYSESTASSVLSAIVSAMVGLTGFVVAFGVLVVQMATQTLSPRFMRLWYRDALQKAVLGTFVGTLTFALALLRRVGPDTVPDIGVTLSGVAVAASVVLFLVYLDRFIHRLRPVEVAWIVADAGARVFNAMQPSTPATPLASIHVGTTPSLEVRAGGAGAIQAIHKDGLLATAIRHDCVLVLPHAVGDIVPHGDVVLQAYGPVPPPAERLRGLFVIGEERTIEQDPAFALRILVDIAIRALSPAVNDPTTTVQVLGAIEDLLILIGESDLRGRGELRDEHGNLRVVLETRRWEDLLALALTEIRQYGATATQVTRRTRALLDRLQVRVRPEHRAAVADHAAALDAALERSVLDPSARAFAGHADPQGIGGSSGWDDARSAPGPGAFAA